jgi:hypothetical protein
MKNFSVFIFIMLSTFATQAFANLYLTTDYQEGTNPKIVTKQHIFLEKPYPVKYTLKSYILILKKITKDEATIESESYDVDKNGHKTMSGGSYGTYKIGKSFTLTDPPKGDRPKFTLKITLDKFFTAK